MNKIFPKIKTDEEVERLLTQDLSDYLNENNFQRVTFKFVPKPQSK
jgi:predicted DNA binding CopG/RHH family protein